MTHLRLGDLTKIGLSIPAKFCFRKFFCQFIHLIAYRLIDDTSIDLRRTEFRMTEHLADGFNGDPIGISNRRGKRMPGKVRGDAFLDSTD